MKQITVIINRIASNTTKLVGIGFLIAALSAFSPSGFLELGPTPVAAQKKSEKNKLSGVLNINKATEKEFLLLPGIGPSKAKAIVAKRDKMGGKFKKIEHIMRVKGIGRGTFKKLKPYLTTKGNSTLEKAGSKKSKS